MGRPKGWLPFGPELLLQRVVRLVSQSVGRVVVVGAPGQVFPELPPNTTFKTDPVEGRGPLAGLATGLEAIGADTSLVYATATDAPFLAPGWVARLADLIGDADLVIPRIEGQLYPLAALYRRETIRPIVRSLRDCGCSRLLDLADAARSREVGTDELLAVDPDLATLKGVNTPDEYRAALLRAGVSD
jgi:molybdopterin-guanine dinucleotide biosynthesis protein A